MPVQIDTPIATGARNDWSLRGAASKMAAVAANDGDTSVIWAFSKNPTRAQTFQFPSLVGIGDPVTAASIHAHARQYQVGTTERFFIMMWNGVDTGSPDWGGSIRIAAPSYIDCAYSAAGAGLTLAAVNGQHGFYMRCAGGPGWEVWVTYVYRSVTYAFSPGASSGDVQFAHIIGSIAAAIGGNLLLREMPKLSRALGNVRLLPDEYERAWRAWRNYKHRVWGI